MPDQSQILTDKCIARLPFAREKQYKVRDSEFPGFFVLANITAIGYNGESFTVNCAATDNRTNASITDHHTVKIARDAETTQPCWLPRPGPSRDRYTVRVHLLDKSGEVQTRSVVASR